MHIARPFERGQNVEPNDESLDRERREFIREAAIRLHVCIRLGTHYRPKDSWRLARELWDARPETADVTKTLEILHAEVARLQAAALDREQLQAEVARLRDMLEERTNTAHVALEQLSAERAAHEATKADLERLRNELAATVSSELAQRARVAVPAADVPTPISDETLRHLTECALAWEPEVRLLGNVTARQLQSFCVELARLRRENPDPECDNCGAVIDGNQAATSDVCHDCWRSARERACTPEERAVLEAWSEKHISDECLNFIIRCGSGPVCQCARAELENRSARRAAKNGGNGGSEV